MPATPRRSAARRPLIIALALLLAAAMPGLWAPPAGAEPATGPVFAKPGPIVAPEQSQTAKAMRRVMAQNKPIVAKKTTKRAAKEGTGRAKHRRTASAPVAEATPAGDYSSATPQTMRDNIVGDFRGVGYQQRMRVENNQLTIRDPQQQGGKVTSVTTDLAPAPDTINFNVETLVGPQSFPLHTYSQWANDKTRSNNGGFGFLFNVFHINTVYLAQLDGYVYLLGTQGSAGYNPAVDAGPPADQYRVRLYKLPMDQAVSGCAMESCAVQTLDFPTAWNLDGSSGFILPYYPRAIGPSALAAGHVGGEPYLAVGMTDDGVYIVNAESMQITFTYTGYTAADSQVVPTALAWDPGGSGLLAVGVTGRGYVGSFAWINGAGQAIADHTWPLAPGDGLIPTPMSAMILDQPNDAAHPKVGILGLSDGTVAMIDPAPAWATTIAGTTGPMPGLPVAINPIPRVNTTVAGGPDFAVAFQGADYTQTFGGVLRWPPGSTVVSLLPIAAQSATRVSAADFDAWYPGLKQGRLKITNGSAEEIAVSLEASPDAGKGCWYAPAWADAAAFPDVLTVEANQVSADYVIGFQSSGDSGSCFTTDPTGTKRAYLVITPKSRPADRLIVQLQITGDLQVSLQDQAGSGSTSATLSTKLEQLGAIGLWNLTVDSSAPPTPAAAPQVSLVQLTPGPSTQDNPSATSPVYKITIMPMSWTVPGLDTSANARLQAVLPPLEIQGSNDGTAWTTLGSFLPIGTVNYNPAQGTATTSGGTVYWENTAAASYSGLRVSAGSGSTARASSPVQLTTAGLTPTFSASSMTVDPASSKAFTPNGVDSFPLTVTVNTSGTSASDPTQSVYYRNSATSALITNLYVAGHEGSFIGVQPSAGAYPNTVGSLRNSAGQSTDYVVTTNPDETDVLAVVWSGSPRAYTKSSAVKITPTLMSLQVDPAAGTAARFALQSCVVGGGCGAADIAPMGTGSTGIQRAALYQAGQLATEDSDAGPPLLGVLFEPLAINDADNSLPLVWTASSTPTVGTSAVTVSYATDSISVANRSAFPSGANTVVVPVVSRGLLILASVAN